MNREFNQKNIVTLKENRCMNENRMAGKMIKNLFVQNTHILTIPQAVSGLAHVRPEILKYLFANKFNSLASFTVMSNKVLR